MSLSEISLCALVALFAIKEPVARSFLENRQDKAWAQEALRYLPHLILLRTLLLRFTTVFIMMALPLMIFANHLYAHFAAPLLNMLPPGHHLISTSLINPFWVPLHLALWAALWVAIPYLIWSLWAFITPALYKHERLTLLPMMFLSLILFYGGAFFAYAVVVPMAIHFFIQILPPGVQMMADMALYYDFVMELMLGFGLAFELPLIMLALMRLNIVSATTFRKHRRGAILGSFIVAMILTPPDVISQCCLAIPLYAVFELGLLLGKSTKKTVNPI